MRASSSAAPPIVESLSSWEAAAVVACAAFGTAGLVFSHLEFSGAGTWAIGLYVAAYAAGGAFPLQTALTSLVRGRLNVDLLMIVAAVGAAFIGDWGEGTVLLFLFSLSGALESYAMGRTTNSIRSLMRLRPLEATLIDAEGERRVAVETLKLGDRLRIRPGERFPADAIVREGETWADESTLTGESVPVPKPEGSDVYAGTINGSGAVIAEVSRVAADSAISRIVRLVEEAQSQKTPTQRFVESWQQPYVIGVLTASTAVFLGARLVHTEDSYDAFYHAMTLLVAASPCAVVISSPAVVLSAIARAARGGVLFKGGAALEDLGDATVMALDKTGTITVGKPGVTDLIPDPDVDANELLLWAATVERSSEHPLAGAVVEEASRRGLTLSNAPLQEFHSHTGRGVHARIDGVWIGVGREDLFETHDLSVPQATLDAAAALRRAGKTALIVRTDRGGGVIGVADRIRPEAASAIASLKRLGISRVTILTGDNQLVADEVAKQVGADETLAGLMPDQKVREIKRLSGTVDRAAMTGDGVNDAPALAAAHVGIAMGSGGVDVALEVADVALMRDDLRALPFAVWISRLARRRVRQNLVFAFGMIATLILASFFELPLWLGVLGHEGSTVLVILNGIRLLWAKEPQF